MIASLHLEHFVAHAARMAYPDLEAHPLAVLRRGKVMDCSPEAALAGVSIGMSPIRAKAFCPEILFLDEVQVTYPQTASRLMNRLVEFSARLELAAMAPTAEIFLDLSHISMEKLRPTAADIVDVVWESVHLTPAVGVASGKFTAHVAAAVAHPGKVALVHPGQERAFLSPLSIDFLPLGREMLRRFRLLGIRTMGKLADMPTGAVLDRFGREGQRLQRLARGQDDRRIPLYHPEEVLSERIQFDGAVTNLRILEMALMQVAEKLSGNLAARGSAAQEVRLTLSLEDGTDKSRSVKLREPVSSRARLAAILMEMLHGMDLPWGVIGVEVTLASVTKARGEQMALFPREAPESQIPVLVGRLSQRYGRDCFYRAQVTNPDAPLLAQRFRLLEAA